MTEIIERLTSMPSIPAFVAIIMAAWRVSWFMMRDGGPFGFMLAIRERIGILHSIEGRPFPYIGGFPGTLLSCMWCLTFWTTIAVFAAWAAFPPVVVILAAWGGACVVESVIGYLHQNSLPIPEYYEVEHDGESDNEDSPSP